MADTPLNPLGERLSETDYVRSRMHPGLRDLDCLILSDLLGLLAPIAAHVRGRVFDYGCGGAPYRGCFSQCEEYVGADVTPGPAVDRLLEAGGLTKEPSHSYDFVFSSQVLEHVSDATAYLREAHRLLRPGGTLLLTTHGMFHEHGCPHDFQRWTSRGLGLLIEEAGFKVDNCWKLTVDARGVIQLMNYFMTDHWRCRTGKATRFLFAGVRRFYRMLLLPGMNLFGRQLRSLGVVPGDHPASVYVGVAVQARKDS